MVGENTNEIIDDTEAARSRSPLLPARHGSDFFVCDVFDAALKGDAASMEHPIFSLSKKPDMKIRRYENGEKFAEIRPGAKGLATVFDRDILIYCVSQLIAAINAGRPVSRTLRLKAHDLLIATNRDTSGRGYLQLRDSLDRLHGTAISTNIMTGGKEEYETFSLISRHRIVRETRDGRMQDVEIELSQWVFDAVEAMEVLTLDRRYFQLAKPLERRLYELARKHVGNQAKATIGVEKLRNKSGSQSTLKEFRRLMQSIIEDDQKHDHMPQYAFSIDGDNVVMRSKPGKLAVRSRPLLHLMPDTYERAKAFAKGWDVHALEAEWRDWITKKNFTPDNPNAHFLAFCKRRGSYPGFR